MAKIILPRDVAEFRHKPGKHTKIEGIKLSPNHSKTVFAYGKCHVPYCGCGEFRPQPGNSWMCSCGHHYNEHG